MTWTLRTESPFSSRWFRNCWTIGIVNELKGALGMHSADQALLVAWGGITKPAEELRQTQRLTIRVWTSEEVIDRLFEVYERLPDDMRARIPLKRTWILDVSEAG
jgi:restriction system protein